MFEVEVASRGGAPLFQPYHILKALWQIKEAGVIGRQDLSRQVGIGEGSTRKLLAHLDLNECVSISKQGIRLTAFGTETVESIGLLAAEADAGALTVAEKDFCVKLSMISEKIRHGVEQRDEAIKVGAKGATTIIFLRDELRLPDGFDVEGAEPEIATALKDKFKPIEGDALFIGTAESLDKAADGAFAAAVWTLNRK